MRRLLFLLLLFTAFGVLQASAQDATVTFYSAGSFVKMFLPSSKDTPYQGCLFDGNDQLGELGAGRYATLRFPPGQHTFSASVHCGKPAPNAQISQTLQAGTHYFFRILIDSPVVGSRKARFEVVSCDDAAKDLATKRPTPASHLNDVWKSRLDPGFPSCTPAVP